MIEIQESLNITQIGKKHVHTVTEILRLLQQKDCKTALEALTVLCFCISYTLGKFKIPKESWYQIQEQTNKVAKEIYVFLE